MHIHPVVGLIPRQARVKKIRVWQVDPMEVIRVRLDLVRWLGMFLVLFLER